MNMLGMSMGLNSTANNQQVNTLSNLNTNNLLMDNGSALINQHETFDLNGMRELLGPLNNMTRAEMSQDNSIIYQDEFQPLNLDLRPRNKISTNNQVKIVSSRMPEKQLSFSEPYDAFHIKISDKAFLDGGKSPFQKRKQNNNTPQILINNSASQFQSQKTKIQQKDNQYNQLTDNLNLSANTHITQMNQPTNFHVPYQSTTNMFDNNFTKNNSSMIGLQSSFRIENNKNKDSSNNMISYYRPSVDNRSVTNTDYLNNKNIAKSLLKLYFVPFFPEVESSTSQLAKKVIRNEMNGRSYRQSKCSLDDRQCTEGVETSNRNNGRLIDSQLRQAGRSSLLSPNRSSFLESTTNLQPYSQNVFGVCTVDENDFNLNYTSPHINKSQQRRRSSIIKRRTSINNSMSMQNAQSENCFDHMVIGRASRYKQFFNMLLIFLAAYSTLSSTYFAAFGMFTEIKTMITYYLIEMLFAVDIIQNFFTEYLSEDDFMPVRDVRKISARYLKSSFFFDLLAVMPFYLMTYDKETQQLLMLFKLFRLPKLFQLMHSRNFMIVLKSFYQRRLKIVLTNPNLKHDQKRDNNKIMTQIMISYVFRIFRLVMIIFTVSYFIGTLWYILVWQFHERLDYPNQQDFFTLYHLDEMKAQNLDLDSMIICVYFAITTLSTIGFGDYAPVTSPERIVTSVILLFGVALFSFVMGYFIEILTSFNSVRQENQESEELTKWLGVLARFNKGRPLPKEVTKKIENYFDYYWRQDRNYSVKKLEDQRFLQELPKQIRVDIYKDFLFKDFLYLFKRYFQITKDMEEDKLLDENDITIDANKNNMDQTKGALEEEEKGSISPLRRQVNFMHSRSNTEDHVKRYLRQSSRMMKFYNWKDSLYSSFMMNIMQNLEPRKYVKGDIILNDSEEVEEVIFVCSGDYAIGYMLKDRVKLGVKFGTKSVIGDHSVILKKHSEFVYQALTDLDCYGLRKNKLYQIFDKYRELGNKFRTKIVTKYQTLIREPVLQHKENFIKKQKKLLRHKKSKLQFQNNNNNSQTMNNSNNNIGSSILENSFNAEDERLNTDFIMEDELDDLRKDMEKRGGGDNKTAMRRIRKLERKFKKLGTTVLKLFSKYDESLKSMGDCGQDTILEVSSSSSISET